MTHRIALLLALLVYLIPSAGQATSARQYTACAKLKGAPTRMLVNLTLPQPLFNFKQTRAQLNRNKEKAHSDWLKFNNMEGVWQADEMETLGEASGGWGLLSQFRMKANPFDSYGTSYCPYFDSIGLDMIYRTVISIPSEFPAGSCAYNVIREHEMRHHQTNVEVAQAMVDRLKQDLPLIISDIETSTSYVPRLKANARFLDMQTDITAAIRIYLQESMKAEMARRNSLIDSADEYRKASAAISACMGQ